MPHPGMTLFNYCLPWEETSGKKVCVKPPTAAPRGDETKLGMLQGNKSRQELLDAQERTIVEN